MLAFFRRVADAPKIVPGARGCPTDERPQPLALALVAAHRLRVDRERELRVRVSHLGHDDRRVLAEGVQKRRERPPQGVRRQPLRQRRVEPLVGPLDRLRQHPAAEVARSERPPLPRGEHESARLRVRGHLEVHEQLAQGREQLHVAPPGVGFRFLDPQPPGREVHVAPAQREQLAHAQPGEYERRQHRPAWNVRVVLVRLRVQLTGRVEQGGYLRRRVDKRAPRCGRAQSPPLAARRVAADQLVLDRLLQYRREQHQRLVYRLVRERPTRTLSPLAALVHVELRQRLASVGGRLDRVALADLRLSVGIDLARADLREPELREGGEQVPLKSPRVVGPCPGAQLGPLRVDPLLRERRERRVRFHVRRSPVGRSPLPALDLREHIGQLGLGSLAGPVGRPAESDVVALPAVADAQPVERAGLSLALDDLADALILVLHGSSPSYAGRRPCKRCAAIFLRVHLSSYRLPRHFCTPLTATVLLKRPVPLDRATGS
ncbi:MAG: hypothetical protein WDZ37_05475 [Solirubrobacterales bacterium]